MPMTAKRIVMLIVPLSKFHRFPILSAIVCCSVRRNNTFGTRKMLQELVNTSQEKLAAFAGLSPWPD
jgi:hypothetical protein